MQEPWRTARNSLRVTLLPQEGETYVLAESEARVGKERSMRQRRVRKYLKTLEEIKGRKKPLKRDQLHQALGAARKEAGRDARHGKVSVCLSGEDESHTATLSYKIYRATLRVARRRDGRSLLRTNLKESDPAKLWEFYLQHPKREHDTEGWERVFTALVRPSTPDSYKLSDADPAAKFHEVGLNTRQAESLSGWLGESRERAAKTAAEDAAAKRLAELGDEDAARRSTQAGVEQVSP